MNLPAPRSASTPAARADFAATVPAAADALFRQEALEARRDTWLGPIVMVRPLSFSLWVALAVLVAGALIGFFAWGEYTRRVTVAGRLMPSAGVVKVFASQAGIVAARQVSEGQHVDADEKLFELSSQHQVGGGEGAREDVQARQTEVLRAREESLQSQVERTRTLQAESLQAQQDRLVQLRRQASQFDDQIHTLHARVDLARADLQRQEKLVEESYLSPAALQTAQANLLEQQLRLQQLEHDRSANLLDQQTLRQTITDQQLRQQSDLGDLDRTRAQAAQDVAESEARSQLVVTAPISGTATAIVSQVGQSVDPAQPMLSILPEGSGLVVQLFAPSSAIGFVRKGDTVRLRYTAYPYQKFGQPEGTVTAVSRTAMTGSELSDLGVASNAVTEPLYRITVTPRVQDVQAFGKAWPLQAGMTVEADVMQEKRKLWEWVVEPLLGLRHRVLS